MEKLMPFYTDKNEKYFLTVFNFPFTLYKCKREIFDFLTVEEKEKFKKFGAPKRQKEWLCSRLALKLILDKYEEIKYDSYGKPFLKNQKISISHSGNYVAIALSGCDVGTDIERLSPKAKRIKNKFLTDFEIQNFIEKDEDYTLLWTVKESVYKFYGKKKLFFKENINLKAKNNNFFSVLLKTRNFDTELNVFFVHTENLFVSLCIKKTC